MIDQIQKVVRKELNKLQYFAIGKIKKIDFENYLVRAEILTTGMVTNWLRIGEGYVGNTFGEAKAPNIDDEVLICFPTGDPGGQGFVIARLYGKDLPPEITEDELVYYHKSGTRTIIRKNGSVEVISKSGLEIIIDDEGKKIKINQGDHQIVMKSDGIYVGSEGAKQPFVLGHALLKWLASMKVVCTAPGQLSSTPIPPPTKELLSDEHFTEK